MTSQRYLPVVGSLLGLATYGVVWLTIAWALRQDPSQVGTPDVYPLLSGAAVFAATGFTLGNVWRQGFTRVAGGALVGALFGYAAAVALLLHPYALPVRLATATVLGAGALAGAFLGVPLEALRERRDRREEASSDAGGAVDA